MMRRAVRGVAGRHVVANRFHQQQLRFAGGTYVNSVLSVINWKPTRTTKQDDELRQELPEIFDRPQEVEDYIRPDKTYFERLEDLWDWCFSFMSPVDKQMEWMRGLHDAGGLSWGLVFLCWGVLMRLISLGPMIYAHRNTLRMSRCQGQISEVTNNIKRIKADKNLTTPERRVMTDGYKRMEKAIYKKHGCSKWGSFIAGASSPLLVTAFMAIRRLAAYEDDLESAGFMWITDLTMPDPTLILPFTCSFLFLMNFEMNQRLNRGGRSAVSLYIRWGIRVGAVAFTYYFSSQPACLFAYWIGMSSAGMLQPVLLRNERFRAYFDMPPQAKIAQQHDENSSWRWVMSKLTNKEIVKKVEVKEAPKYESINDQDIVLDVAEVPAKSK
jgi:membrane protein insertase Oxa1/YidC/SpoIIIJ